MDTDSGQDNGQNPPTTTSFFRSISHKLASSHASGEAEAPAHAAPSNETFNPSTNQVTSSLLTQVQQQPPSPGRDAANNHRERANGSRPPSSGPGSGGVQRVHASELVEKARQIRGLPKNTSPIDASAHPSLLPPPLPHVRNRKCLILDVDETLVHSSYQRTDHYDVHLVVNLNPTTKVDVFVAFRPYLQEFLAAVAPLFEVVIFTASIGKYCDPLMDAIDGDRILGNLRLFREHCSLLGATFVKDLSLLGRDLDQVAIIDNSPVAYLFQQRNAIPITSWFDDPNDEELRRLIPVLQALVDADTVYDVLDNYNALLQLQQQSDMV